MTTIQNKNINKKLQHLQGMCNILNYAFDYPIQQYFFYQKIIDYVTDSKNNDLLNDKYIKELNMIFKNNIETVDKLINYIICDYCMLRDSLEDYYGFDEFKVICQKNNS